MSVTAGKPTVVSGQGGGQPRVLWFRRDLRLEGNQALVAAAGPAVGQGGRLVALFVLDPRLLGPSGSNRKVFLFRALRSLDRCLGGQLVVRVGDPVEVVPSVAAEAGASAVFCAADFGPYGHKRDNGVAQRLRQDGRRLETVGSPYAVEPGSITKADGSPYHVFTPFYRSWRTSIDPLRLPPSSPPVQWCDLRSDGLPDDPPTAATLPEATEAAAHRALAEFVRHGLLDYDQGREWPGEEGTSRLSPYLKFGLLHPHQVLAALAESSGPGVERFRCELAWREFYSDVLWHDPASARRAWLPQMRAFRGDEGGMLADTRFDAWAEGLTGYPLVDAGMRQLLAEGWMHNRVRMVTASFFVKDLHLPWQRGARHFLAHLVDGDLASNQHGWQWTAGCGTDAAPFIRIFNPVSQSRQFDPKGVYLRRYVPELADLNDRDVHEPWRRPWGPPNGYPEPIVDHAVEREVALARFAQVTGGLGRGSHRQAGRPR